MRSIQTNDRCSKILPTFKYNYLINLLKVLLILLILASHARVPVKMIYVNIKLMEIIFFMDDYLWMIFSFWISRNSPFTKKIGIFLAPITLFWILIDFFIYLLIFSFTYLSIKQKNSTINLFDIHQSNYFWKQF